MVLELENSLRMPLPGDRANRQHQSADKTAMWELGRTAFRTLWTDVPYATGRVVCTVVYRATEPQHWATSVYLRITSRHTGTSGE